MVSGTDTRETVSAHNITLHREDLATMGSPAFEYQTSFPFSQYIKNWFIKIWAGGAAHLVEFLVYMKSWAIALSPYKPMWSGICL